MNSVERYQRLQAYETEATRRALDSLATIPDGNRRGPAYDRAVRLVPHIALARRIWLARLREVPHEMPGDWFPAWGLDQSRSESAELDKSWNAYLAGLADEDLSREIRYRSSEGSAYASRIDDVLTHVFNHSTYHRGQMARLVDECGGKRAVTDFIAVTRRTV